MPCRFFEPQKVVDSGTRTFGYGRLPLIDEYDGVCHLHDLRTAVSAAVRAAGCNSGVSASSCSKLSEHLRLASASSGIMRFSVLRQHAKGLDVAVIEELNFAPLRWQIVTFDQDQQAFDPELSDVCQRAQLLAFCRSHLHRFSSVEHS